MSKVVITGGTGFVGKRLVEALAKRGDEVVVLSRRPESAKGLPPGARAAAYEPTDAGSIATHVEGADAVVHLAGESVAQRWTDAVKERIVSSRVDTTRALASAIEAAGSRPRVLVSASGIGYYGSRDGDELLAETASAGDDFLAGVVKEWEAEAQRAAGLGVRVVCMRIGIVLGAGGGALEKMTLPFKLGVGGPIGNGRQVVSWIHLDDLVGLCLLALDDDRVRGPLNAVAPNPVTNAELSKAIGRTLHRPSWIPVPKLAIRLAMGDAAEALTTGQRVSCGKARELGYSFRYDRVEEALAEALGR